MSGEDICDNEITEDNNKLSFSFSNISKAGETNVGCYFQNS